MTFSQIFLRIWDYLSWAKLYDFFQTMRSPFSNDIMKSYTRMDCLLRHVTILQINWHVSLWIFHTGQSSKTRTQRGWSIGSVDFRHRKHFLFHFRQIEKAHSLSYLLYGPHRCTQKVLWWCSLENGESKTSVHFCIPWPGYERLCGALRFLPVSANQWGKQWTILKTCDWLSDVINLKLNDHQCYGGRAAYPLLVVYSLYQILDPAEIIMQ